jgi:hypothetical protein
VAHSRFELAAGTDNIGFGSAFVGETQHAADIIERQFLSVVQEHDARFEGVERFENEAPIAAAAFFHFEIFVDIDAGRIGQLRRLRFGDPDWFRGSSLDGRETAVPRDHIKPG